MKKLSTEEYRALSKKRNAVEAIPSVLRRKYHVDNIPVKGLVRSKIWFSFKIGAINVKRVINKAASLAFKTIFSTKVKFLFFTQKYNPRIFVIAA